MGFVRKTVKQVSNVLSKVDDIIIQPVVNTVEDVVEDPKKLAIVALAVAVPGAGAAIGSALAPAAAAGTQAIIGNAVMGGLTAEASGGDFVEGALLGGAASGLSNVVSPAVSEAVGGGTLGNVASNAVVGGTLAEAQGGDFLKGAAASGVGSLLQTDVSPSIAESVGGGTLGNVVSGAVTGGIQSAVKGNDILTGAITGGIGGITEPLSESDASFMAEDAKQLAKQGLSEDQISDTLSANYASTTAADIAANLATKDLSTSKIEKQLDELSKTVGLTPVTTTDSEMIAADALGIAEAAGRDNNLTGLNNDLLNKGTNIGAVEQNLIATGVDPLVAADISNKIALDPTISVDDLSTYVKDFYGDTIYDVEDLNFDPTPPEDTRPEGEIVVDTSKQGAGASQAALPNMSANGLFTSPTTNTNVPSNPSNYGNNIAFGNFYQNPFTRSREERQSLISGLFNL